MINFNHALLVSLKAPEGMEYLWFSDHKGLPDHKEQVKRAKENIEGGIWIVVIPQMLSSEEWRSLKSGGAEFYDGRIRFKELTLYLRNLSYLNEGEKKNRIVNSLIGDVLGTHRIKCDINHPILVLLLDQFHKPSTIEDVLSEISVNAKLKSMGFYV